ncbi:DUF255 domain-containing protein [Sphingobacterium puteale]|uniref:DUF255 domain-containing protein n=1 Tax=Sphingobacterium puteale TaxID=2420510 RepID=A0A420W1A1_9SPHI|nr:thioredoxin family protein [Sphingobacterium puteale]RKO72352.1 DUF255 domain-containing protein [Sphingobacterium puteale]
MKKIITALLLFVGILSLHAQDHIAFQKISFEDAKKQAKETGKLIFLDGYTSWCVPCKWMEGNVFNQSQVVQYFNTKFINVKFDCEAGEGIAIAKNYQIRSFPTYLFINGDGELIYRTQSKMEANEFLEQGQRANMREYQIPVLKAAFQAGDRQPNFLLRYILVMNNVDQALAEEGRKALAGVANDNFLKSPDGWEVIKMMARSDQDKYARFFQANKAYFKSIAKPEDFEAKETYLIRYAMYGFIRDGKKADFDAGLAYFSCLKGAEAKIEVALFRAEWVGNQGTPEEFVRVTNELRKGVLKDEDQRLSFIARRFAKDTEKGAKNIKLQQCYVLAKQAVQLNPNDYSNQGTFADICIQLKKKKEAVKAAEAARALAELETSKIIKLADALLARAKSI